jgi:hypothetical protein
MRYGNMVELPKEESKVCDACKYCELVSTYDPFAMKTVYAYLCTKDGYTLDKISRGLPCVDFVKED